MKNNNSGFTLVELLGVIVIIGILATVAGLAVFQIIHNQQEKLLEDQIATLKDTAVTYVLSKETYLESCGNALDTNNPDCYNGPDSVSYTMVEEKIKTDEINIFKFVSQYEKECVDATSYTFIDLRW